MLSALWGPDELVDRYLCSIATAKRSDDALCLDPQLIPLRSTPDSDIPPTTSSFSPLTPPGIPHPAQASPTSASEDSSSSPAPSIRQAHSPSQPSSLASDQNSPDAPSLRSTPSTTATSSASTPLTNADANITPSQFTSTPDSNTISTASRFACREPGCLVDRLFGSQKDLDRHFDSIHGTDIFYCRCDKPEKRKDNQDRHVRKCRLVARGPYRCPCGHATDSPTAHLEHIGRRIRNRQTRRFRCPSTLGAT